MELIRTPPDERIRVIICSSVCCIKLFSSFDLNNPFPSLHHILTRTYIIFMLLHVVNLHSFVLSSTSRTSLLNRPEERTRHRPHSLPTRVWTLDSHVLAISTIPPADQRVVKLSGKKIVWQALRLNSSTDIASRISKPSNSSTYCGVVPNAIQKLVSKLHHIGYSAKHLHSKARTVPGQLESIALTDSQVPFPVIAIISIPWSHHFRPR